MQIQHQPTFTNQERLRSNILEAAWNRVMKRSFLVSDIKEEFPAWIVIFVVLGSVILVSVFYNMSIQ